MFAGQNAANEEDEEEVELRPSSSDEPSTIASPGAAFMLPKIPPGGFKLHSTAKDLRDDSVVKKKESPPHETRASFPLSHWEKTHGIVVENLLEKQLSKADIKMSSLPSTTGDQVDNPVSPVDENSEEYLSASTNSLEEIEKATRRVSEDSQMVLLHIHRAYDII